MIISKVTQYIAKEKLLQPTDKVLVALSGGADSVALLIVLIRLGYACEALHCNFHLRGRESDRDEEFVRELCLQRGVALHVKHFETTRYAKEKHISIEMAARELRYDWFEAMRMQRKASVIAVAHHRDDSVETVLLNLIRGTSINGLCGIHAKNNHVVRPLLCVGREEIQAYLEAINQAYVTDSTNLQDEYTRNKIRLNLLPLMEEINPSVKEGIARMSTHLADVANIYNRAVENSSLRIKDGKGIYIEALLAEAAPKTLLFETLSPLGFNSKQVDDVYDSLGGQPGKVFLSKDWRVIKDRTHLLIHKRSVEKEEEGRSVISQTGLYLLGENRQLIVELLPYDNDFSIPTDKSIACVDFGKVSFPLTVRRWRKGDSFVPFGMKGKKKVSDYLTDRKYSIQEKEEAYVVCLDDEIVWLVGERIDNRYRIGKGTENVLVIRWGG